MSVFFIKLLATTKQLIGRTSIFRLKNQAIFSQSEHRDRLDPSPPPAHFHSLFKGTPRPLHNKPFIKKDSLEEMEGVNDNASAFIQLNVKANK